MEIHFQEEMNQMTLKKILIRLITSQKENKSFDFNILSI